MLTLTTEKYEIYPHNDGYRAVVYNYYLARRVQKLLKYYPEGTKFNKDDEPLFTFDESKLFAVLKVLGVDNPNQFISAQIKADRGV